MTIVVLVYSWSLYPHLIHTGSTDRLVFTNTLPVLVVIMPLSTELSHNCDDGNTTAAADEPK